MNSDVLLQTTINESTVCLTLNRPARRNALTIELMESLCEALQDLAVTPDCRAVILNGAGSVFCAGLDLIEAAETELADRSAECVARTFQAVLSSPLVTIAVAHGAACAGGGGLMVACDFVVASDDLRVCFPEVRRGLVPALASVVLRRRLRDADLRRLLLLAESIDAQQGLAVGLLDCVVSSDRLLDEAQTLIATVLRGAPQAVRHTKELLVAGQVEVIEQQFHQALNSHKLARHSPEAAEGLVAFREKREPNWPSD
ncbi:enoyl-CoA hydratase/isomerase family protein [bacterium]|nr:enoyl-CoA hydratase/isomerase family protein [bacterium]